MKKLVPFLAILILASFTLESCKKYEDGPAFSFRSAKGRIKGKWKVTDFTVNGQDELNGTYTGTTSMMCAPYTISFTETWNTEVTIDFEKEDFDMTSKHTEKNLNSLDTYYDCIAVYENDISTYTSTGSWTLEDGKKELELDYDLGGGSETYEIIRLTNKEMKLKAVISGFVVEMTLESAD